MHIHKESLLQNSHHYFIEKNSWNILKNPYPYGYPKKLGEILSSIYIPLKILKPTKTCIKIDDNICLIRIKFSHEDKIHFFQERTVLITK